MFEPVLVDDLDEMTDETARQILRNNELYAERCEN